MEAVICPYGYPFYGNALKIWLAKHDCLSEEEIALCYFCYIE